MSQKEINEALNNIKLGKKFPTWLYKGVKEECVLGIPEDINGLKNTRYKLMKMMTGTNSLVIADISLRDHPAPKNYLEQGK